MYKKLRNYIKKSQYMYMSIGHFSYFRVEKAQANAQNRHARIQKVLSEGVQTVQYSPFYFF